MADANLTKRGDTYYMRVMVSGKRFLRSLGTGDKADARKRAKARIETLRAGRYDITDNLQRDRAAPTIDEIGKAYADTMVSAGKVSAGTAANYLRALKVMVRLALGREDAGAVSTSELTADLVETYEARVIGAATDKLKAARTAASTYHQARALFSRRALRLAYKGMAVPDLKAFCTVDIECSRPEPMLPDSDLWQKTLAAAEQWHADRLPLYPVFVLEYLLGLRRGEAVAARWDWIRVDQVGPATVRTITIPQAKTGFTKRLQVDDELWARMQTFGTYGTSEWIIDGAHKTARLTLAGRTFSTALRALGYDPERFEKTGHTLRKMGGSVVWTAAGPQFAQAFLGHRDIRTTQTFYARLMGLPPSIRTSGEGVSRKGNQ